MEFQLLNSFVRWQRFGNAFKQAGVTTLFKAQISVCALTKKGTAQSVPGRSELNFVSNTLPRARNVFPTALHS